MTGTEILMVLGSALLHASWSAAIKGSRDPLAFNALQTAFACLLGIAVLASVGLESVPRAVVWGAAITGIPHALYFYWLSRALERGDLSAVYPIVRSTPALVPLVAIPVLGESISWIGAAGIAVVVAGVWLVQSGGALGRAALRGPGAGFALAALGATLAYSLIDKRAMAVFSAADWSAAVPRGIVFFFLLYGTTALFFLPLVLRRVPLRSFPEVLRRDGVRAGATLLVSVASYGLILEAFQTAPVSYVVAVRQSSVLFALAIAVAWLGEAPGWMRGLGALATVAGVALIATAP